MTHLDTLKEAERILAFSYWENFKWQKELAQAIGGNSDRVKKLGEDVERIRLEWNDVQNQITNLLVIT